MLKYVNINNEARKILNISFLEYVICEMVYHLSSNPESKFPGWCYMSRNTMSEEVGMKKRGLLYAIDRLEEKDLLIRNELGHLKTTKKWYENTVVQKVHPPSAKSAPPPVQKVHPILIEDNNIDKSVGTHTKKKPINPVIDHEFDPCQYIYSTLGKSGQIIRERWMMQYKLDDIDLDEQMEQFSRYYFAKLSEEYGEDNATAQIERMKLRGLSAKFENSFLRYYKKQA